MALISSPRTFLTGSLLPPFPNYKRLHGTLLVPFRSSIGDGASSGENEAKLAKLAKLAMVSLAVGMLALGSVDPMVATAAKSGGRVGGQAF
ncbi:hypothetical protein ZIOFF_056903 [Zingiber officinale]|uniref:Uncharacterized protein n=1 Tax=Zingiber officinale TaxID=94328 RepID=A0A8J5FIL0_ZINOF|nr:hypothetical protein ZIOFF_056903 [Zingiber officinale]